MKNYASLADLNLRKDYNQVLSEVALDLPSNFAALASPTLSKQESVTSLYSKITEDMICGMKLPRYPWRRLLEFVPRVMLMFFRVVYASLRFKVRNLPAEAVVFNTWLVPRSVEGSTLVDDYFRQLPEDLSEFENVIVSYTSTDVSLLNKFGRIQRNNRHIISYGLLSILDVVRLFWDFLSTALVQTRKKYLLNSVDVSAYINQSLLLDYLELRSLTAFAEKYKCQKFIHHKIKVFVYIFENQSWEKASCDTLHGSGIRRIGYQSSGFSPVFLNFFPTEIDAQQHPMPDIVLTVGDYFRRYLLEQGHYSIPLESFAALRFSYPTKGDRYTVLSPNSQILGRILYALPVHIKQYANTINDLIQVFQNSGVMVELKLHPLYRLSDIKGLSRLPDNFRLVTEVDMDTLRETFDCVLFNDNSFGIEALLKGVKSYQYSWDGSFADDRFMYFNLWQVNYQLVDLRRLKDSIQSLCYDKNFDVEAVSNYLNGMYQPYNRTAFERFWELVNTDDLVK